MPNDECPKPGVYYLRVRVMEPIPCVAVTEMRSSGEPWTWEALPEGMLFTGGKRRAYWSHRVLLSWECGTEGCGYVAGGG